MDNSVGAIILAGGKGTRLAPLTEDTPKPLLKVLGRTVLENVLDRLKESGVTRAAVTTMYLPWQIESLGKNIRGVSVDYVRESSPLGTAGAAKNAFDGKSDSVIVLSGDGIYDFDLGAAIKYHFEKNADVTIVTYKTEDPLEYGVVLYGSDGKIERFAEKPPWEQVVSGTVNTGIYIMKSDILSMIPAGTEYDFAKDLFPRLLADKSRMYAYEAEGTWHDIGNLDEYYNACCSALEGKIKGITNDGFTEKELKDMNIDAETPLYVSRSAHIGENVKLGAYTVIGDGAVISDNCDIAGSIIGDGANIGMGCGIYGSIVGRKAKIGENCISSDGCAIGANAETDDGVILPKYSFIHSSTRVSKSDYLSHRSAKKEKYMFGDNGISCPVKDTGPDYFTRIGYSASGAVCAKKTPGTSRIGVMCDDNPQSRRVLEAVLCGVQSYGVRSYDLGRGFEAMARFASLCLITDIVIYVTRSGDSLISVKIFDDLGLPVSRAFERDMENSFYMADEYSAPDRFYETEKFEGLHLLYYSELVKACRARLGEDGLRGFRCAFPHEGEISHLSPTYTAINAICEIGGSVARQAEDECRFRIDDKGLDSSCEQGSVKLDSFHMNAILIDKLKSDGGEHFLHIPCTSPDAYRSLAEKNSLRYTEYASSSSARRNMPRNEMYSQMWLCDGVFRTLCFASLLKSSGSTPEALAKQLPNFEIYESEFEGSSDRAGVMQRLSKMSSDAKGNPGENVEREGVRLIMANGTVTVIPGKSKGFRIISEARSAEAAKELCAEAEEYLK